MNYPSKEAPYCCSKTCSLDPTNVNTLWNRATLAKEIGQINTVRPVLSTAFGPEDMKFLQLTEAQTYVDFNKDLTGEAAEITEALGELREA